MSVCKNENFKRIRSFLQKWVQIQFERVFFYSLLISGNLLQAVRMKISKEFEFFCKNGFQPIVPRVRRHIRRKKRLHLNVKEVPPLFYCCELS